jgi:predicted 3-demethylubiquinone-9 3-methyltransferase (glyoxalase superfamily)
MQKISPFLWFDGKAEDAAKLYVSIFKNSKITDTVRYGNAGPGKKRSVMSVTFKLAGQEFIALNGGPMFQFTPAVSFFVKCETQKEVDRYWSKLLAGGGKESRCGWLQDRFGLSWQIVPHALGELMHVKDPAQAERVMKAMMQMVKLDIQALKDAAADGAKPGKAKKKASKKTSK